MTHQEYPPCTTSLLPETRNIPFAAAFAALTGHTPMRWQQRLFDLYRRVGCGRVKMVMTDCQSGPRRNGCGLIEAMDLRHTGSCTNPTPQQPRGSAALNPPTAPWDSLSHRFMFHHRTVGARIERILRASLL